MKDNSNPKLLVNKDEASKKIQDRINVGKGLYKVQIFSKQEYDNLRHERKKWVDYNKSLFDSLFDKSPLSNWHGYSIGYSRVLDGTLFQQNIESLKRNINNGINQLESIYEQLELYEEITPTKEKLRDTKTKVIAYKEKFKKNILAHIKKIILGIITSLITAFILFYIGC